MIKAREPLDTNSIQQHFFEQDVLMHFKGLQMRALGGWGLGSVASMNNMLLNSYDCSYLINIILGPPQNFEGDTKLNTRQIAQMAKMLRLLPPNSLSLKLDLGNINNRVFLRMLKSIFRKVGRLSELSFKPDECPGSTWLDVLSKLKKSQPTKLALHMRESQFFLNKEKIRNSFLKVMEKVEELSFEAFPLKVKSKISWFADTQRMMDVFSNIRKIHIDPFSIEDSYFFNYQRLFNTMVNLEDLSLVCYNRDYFRKMTTHLVLPEKLKTFQITFVNIYDKESWKNILNDLFASQRFPRLETLHILIKFKPMNFFPNQKLPTVVEFPLLQGLHCPNLKTLKLRLAVIQRVSLIGLEKLTKLETFDLEVSSTVKKVNFTEGNPFPDSLKRFSFVYCGDKPHIDIKSEVYHYFWAFLNKTSKTLQSNCLNQISELRLSEVVVNNDIIQAIPQENLETLVIQDSFILEKEFSKLLNSDRLTSLIGLHIRTSQLRSDVALNPNDNLISLIAQSPLAARLEELSVVGLDFYQGNLQFLQPKDLSFPKLKRLDLSQNIKLEFRGLSKLLKIKMPCLESLNIEHIKCSYVDLEGLLLKQVPNLKELKLSANELEIEHTETSIEFRRKFLKVTNYGLFTSRA